MPDSAAAWDGSAKLRHEKAGTFPPRPRDKNEAPIGAYFPSFSHCWFAMPQLVLQADWQEVWHSPQPPFSMLFSMSLVFKVMICFIAVLFL